MKTADELKAFRDGFDGFCKEAGMSATQQAAVTAAAASLSDTVAAAFTEVAGEQGS